MKYFDKLCLMFLLLIGETYGVLYRINESEYHRMPPLFAMDPYESCMVQESATYCIVDGALYSERDSELVNLITEYSAWTKTHFNHTQIHRGVCVTKTCAKFINGSDLKAADLDEILEACLNDSIWREYELQVHIENIRYCDRPTDKTIIDGVDIFMIFIYVIIIVINFAGTLYDVLYFRNTKCEGNMYLLSFSVPRNWDKLNAPGGDGPEPRLERLKLFNGLRAMTMACVFFSHTVLVMLHSYIDNPLYIETSYHDISKQIIFNGSLVVFTFFVMSAFLLAYNLEIHSETHSITWLDIPIGILQRWLRLTPTYALVLATICTWFRHIGSGPLWQLVVGSEAEACRRYWWLHLLYVNNYVYEDALCTPQTWYLAADTQLFCMGLVVCVLARSGAARKATLLVLFVLALLIPAAHTYFQDLGATVIQRPETNRNLYATDDTFRLLYTRGHTNIATYTLGLAAGFLTYYWQKNDIDVTKYRGYRWLYWAAFPAGVIVILTGGICYLDNYEPPTAIRVLYAMVYKPTFQIMVLILIVGAIFKLETVYRAVLEWRGWTWPGRVSYSAFLLHTLFQRAFFGTLHSPQRISDYYVITLLCATIFITYMSAVVLWLLVEQPMNQFFKVLLRRKPRVPRLEKNLVEKEVNSKL